MADPKPDPKPEPKPEPTPAPRPDPKPEPQTEPQAGRTEMEELTVPVQVGADIGQLARAATANRTVGIDDDPENAARMVEAVEDASTTVNLTVNQPAGKPLPVPARAAIAREKRRGEGASSRSARTAGTDAELRRGGPLPEDLGLHSVTINDRQYSWSDDDESGVPPEALEVHKQSVQANTASTGIPAERMP